MKIAECRLRLTGHCYRHAELRSHKPTHGTRRRGRPKATCVGTLMRDTETTIVHDLVSFMEDRDVWRPSFPGFEPWIYQSKIRVSTTRPRRHISPFAVSELSSYCRRIELKDVFTSPIPLQSCSQGLGPNDNLRADT
ncbi:hypothetical protein ElyMa_006679000 [Elysia marginata]|uniref:C2H2-type domain-containing protein n=1 Tax=Elysia marginata TaxID=1093978 RepID=A0AAV4ISL1_9GAST|nr:hypothetical protein ElyMa_006679000 [Elysia marginata]